ncbi:MAG TPA: hypothetical protein VKU01_16180 [Bryobacteraceae bacterium]|nr:hypothetical protein [Bryobacteraceae bacterium]
MGETITKLQPDRDLQCYFYKPSAIAAMSHATPNGFTVSGSWRQQFDWAVIEWNRDNVFEHPLFRKLPDGDLSGLLLSYDEVRTNCIPLDSDLYPTVDWPTLRIWADDGSGEQVYRVLLADYATPVSGSYQNASTSLTLSGTPVQGDRVGFAFLTEQYSYQFVANDSFTNAMQAISAAVNQASLTVHAMANGASLTLTLTNATSGTNGNRLGLYTFVSGTTESWDASWKPFSGGTSPTQWRVVLPFASLSDPKLGKIPTNAVRKMRWTYAADLQPGTFQRCEFSVVVSNWTVSGAGATYQVAGPGSRRFEDTDPSVQYSSGWTRSSGNFSGGTIHSTSSPSSTLNCAFASSSTSQLYLGTRLTFNGATIGVSIDGGAAIVVNLLFEGEDVLVRHFLGTLVPGRHTVAITHQGDLGTYFYFDFLELAIPVYSLSAATEEPTLGLATDWDTDHSIALPAERTAWLIHALGFRGRVNHYAGAMWFYELACPGEQYASATITFTGTPDAGATTTISIGNSTDPTNTQTPISHVNTICETAASLAKALELEINRGYTAIRAQAAGNQLTIYARAMGTAGNAITLGTSPPTSSLTIQTSGNALNGGVDGNWRTDLQALPRINRAARDWSAAFFEALKGYGLDVAASFSMELQHGDPDAAAGIAQIYPDGNPCIVNTPALQTNFSPQSTSFWQQVYLDMANLQASAGLRPYLQFGEVQWWYFPDDGSGMPFYDAYTTESFRTQYGRDMAVITSNDTDPATVAQEAQFLSTLIGNFTTQIMQFVRSTLSTCRFEVLYPTDVNSGRLNAVVNYPTAAWTPSTLDCLKTESFTYTYGRNLDLAKGSMESKAPVSFPPSQRSHLVGISDSSTAWLKEARLAQGHGFESAVLFALDQFCLVGYRVPLSRGLRRSFRAG